MNEQNSEKAPSDPLKAGEIPTAAPHRSKLTPRVPSYLPVRIFSLVMLVLGVQFWLQHHYSISFWQGLGGGVIVSVVLSVTRFIWEGLFGPKDERWKQPLHKLALFLVQTPVLIGMAFLLIIAGSLVSTVTVIADGEDSAHVQVFASSVWKGDAETLDGDDDVQVFLRSTNPLGRLYTLEADGFRPYVFDLLAWRGKRIRLGRDLERVPTLLVRVPSDQLQMTANRMVRLYPSGQPNVLAEVTLKKGTGSALFGRPRAIPQGFVTKWTWEAQTDNESEKGVANDLLRWHEWIAVDEGVDGNALGVAAGMNLEAKLKRKNGELIASRRFIVGGEPIQDILLIPEASE